MFTIGPATSGSDISSVKCCVCRLKVPSHRGAAAPPTSPSEQVLGAAVMCSDCGHAGHPQHVLTWFTGATCALPLAPPDASSPPSHASSPPSHCALVTAGHDVCPAMGCRCTCLGIRQQLQQQQHQQQQQRQQVEPA
jgi:hypothetical protein